MISYLKGAIASIQKPSAGRVIVTIEVNQIGYDLQVVPRLLQELPALGDLVQVFTHMQVKEDQTVLYGFGSTAERDLFRQLISVSGVGPQLALALLVQAIVTSNTRMLSRTPGVGTKTAERLALELKTKLAEWRMQSGLTSLPDSAPTTSIQEDVEMTLLALGYTNGEIMQALRVVGQETALAKNADAEAWIRQAIAWLSR
jgi:Holliday junction DNA helicase RuvA